MEQADALKNANYGLTFWTELRNFLKPARC